MRFDLISLKLGINLVNTDLMRLRAFGPAVHGFLDKVPAAACPERRTRSTDASCSLSSAWIALSRSTRRTGLPSSSRA